MYPRLLAPDRPDWRWARVADLSQQSNTQAAARLQSEDEQTRLAYNFRRALDRGQPDEYPEQHAAHYLYHSSPYDRFYLEGMLLAGEPNERIAPKLGVGNEGVVQAFHDLFFAVRPYLRRPNWVISHVFEGPVYKAHQHDRRGLITRMAWLVGAEVFEKLYHEGAIDPATQQVLRDLIDGLLHAQCAELVFSASSRGEMPEWVTGFLAKGAEQGANGGADDYQEALGSFLDGLNLSVADPTDERNLNLPAREPRAVEYEVVTNA